MMLNGQLEGEKRMFEGIVCFFLSAIVVELYYIIKELRRH